MLGIADLHTPEAVAAAESAISNGQPLVSLDSDSSETETEVSDDDDDNNEAHSDNADDDENDKACSSLKHKASKFGKDDSSGQAVEKNGSKKRPKIVEMA